MLFGVAKFVAFCHTAGEEHLHTLPTTAEGCVFSAVSLFTPREMNQRKCTQAIKDGCVNESTDAVLLEARELCLESPVLPDELPAVAFTGRDLGGSGK